MSSASKFFWAAAFTSFAIVQCYHLSKFNKPCFFLKHKLTTSSEEDSKEIVSGKENPSAYVTTEVVRKLSLLSQIEMGEKELSDILPRVQQFLNFVDIVKAVDTGETSSGAPSARFESIFRDDGENIFGGQDIILKNFPLEVDGYLFVPKLGESEVVE